MPIPRRVALALLPGLVLASAHAWGMNELFAKDAPIAKLTAEDFKVATPIIRAALDAGKVGELKRWSNPSTAASGTVTVLSSFEKDGMQCRGAEFGITAARETGRSAWNLCRTPAGWKVLEGR